MNCPILSFPNVSKPFVLECDASGESIGAVLKQGQHPISFESRKLHPHENIYSINDKEMLAIIHALIKFRHYLVGNKFVVKIDHNNLRYFLTQKDLNERKQKWVSKIQAFDFDIEYVKGKNNVVVDALSRRPSMSLMDVAENWKAILEVEYAEDKFYCERFYGTIHDDRYKVLEGILY